MMQRTCEILNEQTVSIQYIGGMVDAARLASGMFANLVDIGRYTWDLYNHDYRPFRTSRDVSIRGIEEYQKLDDCFRIKKKENRCFYTIRAFNAIVANQAVVDKLTEEDKDDISAKVNYVIDNRPINPIRGPKPRSFWWTGASIEEINSFKVPILTNAPALDTLNDLEPEINDYTRTSTAKMFDTREIMRMAPRFWDISEVKSKPSETDSTSNSTDKNTLVTSSSTASLKKNSGTSTTKATKANNSRNESKEKKTQDRPKKKCRPQRSSARPGAQSSSQRNPVISTGSSTWGAWIPHTSPGAQSSSQPTPGTRITHPREWRSLKGWIPAVADGVPAQKSQRRSTNEE